MKYTTSILLAAAFLMIAGCGNNNDFYVTNNVLEANIINLQSEVPGKVVYSQIERGMSFKKGDVVVVIDTTIIHQEMQTLLAKRDGINAKERILKSNLNILNENIAYFNEQTDKWVRLAKSQAGPQQRVDDFEHQLKIAKLNKVNLQQQIDALRPEREALKAQIAKVKDTIAKYTIHAPIDGQVIDKFINRWEMAAPGVPLAQITNDKKLHVYLYWPIDMMSRFEIGSKVELFVDGQEKPFAGTVSWVSPKAEFTPKIVQSAENRAQMSYQVRIEVNNDDGKLKIGQPVEAHLSWMKKQ